MKRKICLFLIAALALSVLVTGCDKKDTPVTEDSATIGDIEVTDSGITDIEIADGDTTVDTSAVAKAGMSIQDEIADVEARDKQLFDEAQKCESQLDMNMNAGNTFKLWDNELNSLWSRLSDELPADKKEAVLADQREWIKRKDAAVTAAGAEVEGGSMQPCIEFSTAADLTRVRVYYFAGLLAKTRGESFVISSDIQTELDALDPDVEAVFASFAGTYVTDSGDSVVILPFDQTDLMADNFTSTPKWVLMISHGAIYTDLDVESYTPSSITFKQSSGYAVLTETIAGGISIGFGVSPDNLDTTIDAY